MSAADHPAEPTPPALPALDDAYFQQILRVVIQAGAKIVQDIADDTSAPAAERAIAYERTARSIHRSIILLRHLAAKPAKPVIAPTPRARRTRDAEIAEANRMEPPERPEAPERPERPERPETVAKELAFLSRPIAEIIAAIQRDLDRVRDRRTRALRRRHRRPTSRAAHPPRPQQRRADKPPGRALPQAREA